MSPSLVLDIFLVLAVLAGVFGWVLIAIVAVQEVLSWAASKDYFDYTGREAPGDKEWRRERYGDERLFAPLPKDDLTNDFPAWEDHSWRERWKLPERKDK